MIDNLPPLKQVIDTHGLAAKKSLGQNFLLDLNLTAKIARLSGKNEDHDVLEIGPGPGGLTRGLLAEGARRVLAIEKDERCLPALAEIEAAYPDRFSVMIGDALDINPLDHLTPPIRVAANLPYNIGTELLIRWLTPPDWPPFWDSLTLMFQREVAQRITAEPGSKSLRAPRGDIAMAHGPIHRDEPATGSLFPTTKSVQRCGSPEGAANAALSGGYKDAATHHGDRVQSTA